jgi:anhydro-N-acetylmuramic acid kinase
MRAIGLMSGTSMDGIDAALIYTDGLLEVKHINGASLDYSKEFRLLLRAAEYSFQHNNGLNNQVDLDNYLTTVDVSRAQLELELGEAITTEAIIRKLTQLHGELVIKLIPDGQIKDMVIGFHGQTVYHNPSQKISLQIGDGQLLANITGLPVVNNFRMNDIKHGGQGAPLAPMYHRVLANGLGKYPIAIVNCGGISNISYIGGAAEEQVIGFDTGPGNILLDKLVRQRTGGREFMDEGGKYGSKGVVDQKLLIDLKGCIVNYQNDFWHKSPPKSLDAGNFMLLPQLSAMKLEDACATLAAFTAECIVESANYINEAPKLWVLCGGGWNNPVICEFLRQKLCLKFGENTEIKKADELGWSSLYMEAEIFAYLAVRACKNLSISLPQITGSKFAVSGGNVYYPKK